MVSYFKHLFKITYHILVSLVFHLLKLFHWNFLDHPLLLELHLSTSALCSLFLNSCTLNCWWKIEYYLRVVYFNGNSSPKWIAYYRNCKITLQMEEIVGRGSSIILVILKSPHFWDKLPAYFPIYLKLILVINC